MLLPQSSLIEMKASELSFWDTSALIALCCRHPSTAQARGLAQHNRKLVVWWGTPVELSSAFLQLVRAGKLAEKELKHALTQKATLRRSWIEVQPSERLRDIAETLPERYGLRGLDSLQLAAALVWCKEKPRHRSFACFDQRLAHAAAKAGFDIIT
jgi:uncharacterized protein